jgi:uncharacterized phiE125 gp8 family phage protein
MRQGIQIVTPPASLPVTLAEAKAYPRIDGSDDDAVINSLLSFATAFIERETGQTTVTTTKKLFLDQFPKATEMADYFGRFIKLPVGTDREIRLPTPPLISVASLKYLVGGVETTWSASNYTVDAVGLPGRIVLNDRIAWPTDCDVVANAVRITFDCGYGAAAAVPDLFKHAIKWMVSHAYEHREIMDGMQLKELPYSLRCVIESLMFREAAGG